MGDEENLIQRIEYYHRVIDTLLAYHIEPIITLYHCEMPINIVKISFMDESSNN